MISPRYNSNNYHSWFFAFKFNISNSNKEYKYLIIHQFKYNNLFINIVSELFDTFYFYLGANQNENLFVIMHFTIFCCFLFQVDKSL